MQKTVPAVTREFYARFGLRGRNFRFEACLEFLDNQLGVDGLVKTMLVLSVVGYSDFVVSPFLSPPLLLLLAVYSLAS